jgi:hypothetical protein
MPVLGTGRCASQPRTDNKPRLSAAIAVDEGTADFRTVPILVTDYFFVADRP